MHQSAACPSKFWKRTSRFVLLSSVAGMPSLKRLWKSFSNSIVPRLGKLHFCVFSVNEQFLYSMWWEIREFSRKVSRLLKREWFATAEIFWPSGSVRRPFSFSSRIIGSLQYTGSGRRKKHEKSWHSKSIFYCIFGVSGRLDFFEREKIWNSKNRNLKFWNLFLEIWYWKKHFFYCSFYHFQQLLRNIFFTFSFESTTNRRWDENQKNMTA